VSEHPNLARLKQLYETPGGIAGLGDMLADDFTMHIPGDSPVAGNPHGKSAVFAYLSKIATLGVKFNFQPLEFMANDRFGVVKHRWTAEVLERKIEGDNIIVYRFDNDGRFAERWEFVEDQAAHDEFWRAAAAATRHGLDRD
jgi:ketosteroid isomerase-like protein